MAVFKPCSSAKPSGMSIMASAYANIYSAWLPWMPMPVPICCNKNIVYNTTTKIDVINVFYAICDVTTATEWTPPTM